MTLARFLLAPAFVVAALLVSGRGGAEPARPRAASIAASAAVAAAAGTTVVFPYQQRRLLYSRNASGGLAYVTSGAKRGAPLPVVVFLHGMNPDEVVHPWFGPAHGDLRPVLEALVTSRQVEPFVVAAPTHTRYATGATVMWPRFDVGDFLDATDAALGELARTDRSRIIVVGHSGAGCNPTGGLFSESVLGLQPSALVDVDGCVDDAVSASLALLAAAGRTRVRFFWQRTWPRPIRELEAACGACKVEEVAALPTGAAPHVAILPEALRRSLPELLPGSAAR